MNTVIYRCLNLHTRVAMINIEHKVRLTDHTTWLGIKVDLAMVLRLWLGLTLLVTIKRALIAGKAVTLAAAHAAI